MECKQARLLLEVAHPLPAELEAQDKEELASHLADCPDCGPWAEGEHRLDDAMGRAIRAVPVPTELAQRILGRLQAERWLWYRVRAVRLAAVAAILFIVFGLVWVLWWNRKPAPNWDEFSEAGRFLYTAQQVEDSFAGKGVEMIAPPQFDYGLLESHGLQDFQGRQVPYLLFVLPADKGGPPQIGEVYVLSNRQFNIGEVPQKLTLSSGRKDIRILRHPERQDVLYVVVVTAGTRFERFFLRELTKPT
jgi:hypothetical protein